MKKYIAIYTLLLAVMLAMFSSCETETSDNGDLDGMWHLMQVDTIATGGCRDMVPDRIYWSFQVRLCNLRNLVKGPDVFCRFEKEEDMLRLHSFYMNDRQGGDPEVTDKMADILLNVMVGSLDQTYHIESISSSIMVLATDELKMRFVKY